MLEDGPMDRMIAKGRVSAVHHTGRWISVDSPKDLPGFEASGLSETAPSLEPRLICAS